MNENQPNIQQYDDEIDLRELVMALWKRKISIISLILVGAILAGLFSMFILSPVFDTNLNIVISMPEEYTTRYGEYTLPITTNEQYINLILSNDVLKNTIRDMDYDTSKVTIEKLKKRITIGKVDTKANTIQNSFDVTVSADNPEESAKLAETLFDNYIKFMDVMTKERAISYYYNQFDVSIKNLEKELGRNKDLLKKNEELLAQTPQIINKDASVEVKRQLTDDSDYVIPVNTANPNYIKIESDIVANKQSINSIEESLKIYNENIKEVTAEKEAIQNYYKTGQTEKLESSIIGVVETSVYLPSPPVAPTQKTSPRNALNTLIGVVLGGMIGVMAALVKEYWIEKAQ